jgi:hypothetical protein
MRRLATAVALGACTLATSACWKIIGLGETHPYEDACVPMPDDPSNCGACGRSCLGATCTNGTCGVIQLAALEAFPTAIAVDPGSTGNVYWMNDVGQGSPGGNVRTIAKDGSPSSLRTLYTPTASEYSLTGLAIDATSVYFTAQGYRDSVAGSIHRIGKDGSGHISIGTFQGPGPLAIDASYVYWANRDASDRVERATRALGSPQVLFTSTAFVGDTVGLAVDADPNGKVYWSNGNATTGNGLEAGAKTGGNATDYSALFGEGVAVDDTNVYFFGNASGGMFDVLSIGKDGTCPNATTCPVKLGSIESGGWIAADQTSVYWCSATAGVVVAANKDGTNFRTLASGYRPGVFAIDDVAVYFTDQFAGQVLKTAK